MVILEVAALVAVGVVLGVALMCVLVIAATRAAIGRGLGW